MTLLTTRRFAPLFVTQFLNAFNDNLFKTAMLFLVTYRLLADDPAGAAGLVSIAAGMLMLPFLLFSGIAGTLADAIDKAKIARVVKLCEIGIMALGAFALHGNSIPLLLAVIFLLGVHSTFFSPIKYAILPQHLDGREVLTGTGLIEGGTFVAILTGQVLGGLIAPDLAAIGILVVAVIGWLSARGIPPAPPAADAGPVDWNPWTSTLTILRGTYVNPAVRDATIAISWFWGFGTVYTTQFIPLVKGGLNASADVATSFLAIFSVGVAAGSIGVARLLKGQISARAAPWALIVLALAGVELLFALRALPVPAAPLGWSAFFAEPQAWRIVVDLFVLAAAGGVFSVPLYAIMATASGAHVRAGAIAANAFISAFFIVGAALAAGAAASGGVPIPVILVVTGFSGVLVLPQLLRLAAAKWTRPAALG
ncbi:MFS transporter [Glacieibacterium frigidum]|uniref:MFS transporter n=1 Tax=Glacieibacterium frigidum TaxID=2593303 RepID=UPI001F20A21A|nr:MFS transporter [Glacieibacterium frigidum]